MTGPNFGRKEISRDIVEAQLNQPITTLPISVFIVTLNEADRIGRTLNAIMNLSTDIVVVDSGSNDGTQEIAASLGARVVPNEWLGYGAQKNFAQDLCQHDWVLNLDADEVVTPRLRDEIRALFGGDGPLADAYAVRVVDVVPGDTAPRTFAYAYNRVRLYRKLKGRFSLSTVHDVVQMQTGSRSAQMQGKIYHYSIRNLGEQVSKFNAYTDAQVADLNERGADVSLLRIWLEFPLAFLKAYILRRHFLGGGYGFLIAMNYAMFRHLRVAKYYEAKRGASLKRDIKSSRYGTDDLAV